METGNQQEKSCFFKIIKNVTLRSYYPQIKTLHEYLSSQCGDQVKLIREGDHVDYINFLKTSAISVTTDKPFPKSSFGEIQDCSFEDVHDCVQSEILIDEECLILPSF
ncbi:5528_t:CDS:1, partial [Acaulospora morrowiae]